MKVDFNRVMAESESLLEKAEVLLQNRWHANPGDWEICWKLAEIQRQMGHFDRALSFYAEVLKLNKTCVKADRISRILAGKDIGQTFAAGISPVPFVYANNLLTKDELDAVWDNIFKNRGNFVQSRIQEGEDLDYRRSKVLHEMHLSALKPQVLARVRGSLEKSWGRLGFVPFDISREEIQLTSHSEGGFYNIHQDAGDNPETCTRTITYVIYIFQEPRGFSGGDLLLFDRDSENEDYTSKFTRIVPQNNSMVLFPSSVWYQVTPVKLASTRFESGRFTLNGWLHRNRTE